MTEHHENHEEEKKMAFTAIRVPAVLLVALIILAIVGYFITR